MESAVSIIMHIEGKTLDHTECNVIRLQSEQFVINIGSRSRETHIAEHLRHIAVDRLSLCILLDEDRSLLSV